MHITARLVLNADLAILLPTHHGNTSALTFNRQAPASVVVSDRQVLFPYQSHLMELPAPRCYRFLFDCESFARNEPDHLWSTLPCPFEDTAAYPRKGSSDGHNGALGVPRQTSTAKIYAETSALPIMNTATNRLMTRLVRLQRTIPGRAAILL